MKTPKRDILEIARYTFVGVILFSIVQKIINPVHYENFSDFIMLVVNLITDQNYTIPSLFFTLMIMIEGFIVIGLFKNRLFNLSAITGIVLISLGVCASSMSYYYGLSPSCGCGLFGDVPQLLLTQKLILLFLLGFLYKNKKLLFNEKKPV